MPYQRTSGEITAHRFAHPRSGARTVEEALKIAVELAIVDAQAPTGDFYDERAFHPERY